MTTESGHDIICRKLLVRMAPFLNTWKDADVICSPSCMFCCSWFCTVIFFSLVMEAIGKLRITVCSPTTGRQGLGSAIAHHRSCPESLLLTSPDSAGEVPLKSTVPRNAVRETQDAESRSLMLLRGADSQDTILLLREETGTACLPSVCFPRLCIPHKNLGLRQSYRKGRFYTEKQKYL